MQRKLSVSEIVETPGVAELPPILIPDEAAELLRIEKSTLYRHVSEGRYSSAVKRGKPLLFWRDRLIQEAMK